MKDKVLNYYNCELLGECEYLLTKQGIFQCLGYAETEDELILDVYEELPEEFWKSRHRIPKNDIIGHFKKLKDLTQFLKDYDKIKKVEE